MSKELGPEKSDARGVSGLEKSRRIYIDIVSQLRRVWPKKSGSNNEPLRVAHKSIPTSTSDSAEPGQETPTGQVEPGFDEKPQEQDPTLSDWLQEIDPSGASQELLTPEGHLKSVITENDPRWSKLNSTGLLSFLKEKLTPIYDLLDKSLLKAFEGSFNRHDIEHVSRVTEKALGLFDIIINQYGGRETDEIIVHNVAIDIEKEKKIMVLAGMIHDLGNLLSRFMHPMFGAKLAEELLEPFWREIPEEDKLRIRRIVKFHDAKVAKLVLLSIKNQYSENENVSAEQKLIEIYGVAGLAILAADKAEEAHETRAPYHDPEALDKVLDDPHSVVASLTQEVSEYSLLPTDTVRRTSRVGTSIGDDNNRVDESFLRQKYSKHESPEINQLVVPKEYTEAHDNEGIPHFLTWLRHYLGTYISRIKLEAEAMFILLPENINRLQIVINDEGASSSQFFENRDMAQNSEGSMSFVIDLSRENYLKELEYLSKNLDNLVSSIPNGVRDWVTEGVRDDYVRQINNPAGYDKNPVLEFRCRMFPSCELFYKWLFSNKEERKKLKIEKSNTKDNHDS